MEPNAQIKVQNWDDVLGGVNALFPVRAATAALGAVMMVLGIIGLWQLRNSEDFRLPSRSALSA